MFVEIARRDRIADQVGNAFLQSERVRYPVDMPRAIFDTDQDSSTRRVGECDNRTQKAVRGRKVPFEFKRLALGFAQRVGEIHSSEDYYEGLCNASLQSALQTKRGP